MIELADLDLPFLPADEYKAVCSAVAYLRKGYSLDNACKYAGGNHSVPVARIKRTIKAGLPDGYFERKARKEMKARLSRTTASFYGNAVSHMRSI